jgi:tetratricopeptide (TPR) repeat protein
VRARTDADETRFAFKHALMRDAAYRSMLSRDRARWHRVIAEVLRDRFPEIGAQQPELLATHCAEAGDHAAAVQRWELAARQAAARSAQLEALAHVQSALDALAHAPPGRERDSQELRLQLMKAARMIATYGYGAEKVAAAYGRARELARALDDRSALQRVLLGLEGYHFMRADFAQARACVLEAAACAGPNVPAIQQIQTQWALANAQMHQGDMEPAVAQMDDCLARYEALDHRPDAVQDPGVMCLCYSAWSKWQLGFPDEALQRAQRVVRVAEHLKHKFSLGEAFGFLAAVRHFRGENREALRSADRAIAICEEGGFSVWLAHARVMRGRALAELGEGWAGIEEMREGCELWASTGAVVTLPFYLTMRAEGLALCGRIDEAAVLLGQALEIVERTGERYYESEIRRHLGRLCRLAAADVADRPEEAQTWLHQALTLARERRMHSLTLRAAADLADLHATAGRPAQALEVLQPAYDAITEGRDTRDLVDAARRLEALRRDLRP